MFKNLKNKKINQTKTKNKIKNIIKTSAKKWNMISFKVIRNNTIF